MAKRTKRPQSLSEPKSSATTRSTGGGGFVFEDQFAAFLLVKMLSGEPIPSLGDDGLGDLIQMQTSSMGWSIDDLLAVSSVANAKLAISCKSSVQVTSAGLPANFIVAAWQQWKARSPLGPFNPAKDKLMLVTRGRNLTFEPLWADIKSWSSHPDNPLALARTQQTAAHSKILQNVKSAIADVDDSVTDDEVIALISCLEVFATDFDLPNSQYRADAIHRCRGLLASGSQDEAVKLWSFLVAEAEAARVSHGMLKLAALWSKLVKEFDLKLQLNYERSLLALDAITSDYKSGIQVTLPSGVALDRKAESDALVERLSSDPVLVVFGESGSGKSALVKLALDQRPSRKQLWLSPDDLKTVLSEASRRSVGLDRPLHEVLVFSAHSENVLVLDAAERLSDELAMKARSLVSTIIEHSKASSANWSVIIIGQVDGWSQGKLQRIGSATLPQHYEVKPLTNDQVQQGLRSVPQLSWASTNDDIVAILTNPRTLAWVLQASTQFQDKSSLLSQISIADHLWRYWTDDKITLQRTLMLLAEREANFEHSFEIRELEAGDAQAIESKPPQLPLRRNRYNRIEFEHDLAADLVRFQRLKGISGDTAKWAALAGNPLWLSSLRMLGGFLLREKTSDGRTAWDVAFGSVNDSAENVTASDVLLDALCLDPNAEQFLTERAELLLLDHGKLLTRFLRRFLHVATVPGGPSKLLGDIIFADPTYSLYLEAEFRTPIPGRWVALARFLCAHQARIAALCSPTVASVCSRWLGAFPAVHAGVPFPLRRQFSELALATARAVQLEQSKSTIFADESVKQIFMAAFAGAPDMPDEVSQWALEMARRRPLDGTVAAAVADYRRKRAADHAEKMRTDADYRARHERKATLPVHIPSSRKLPPWPLGPQGRLDHHFRDSCTQGSVLAPLMRTRPLVAAELLLAVVIEGEPEDEYSNSRYKDELGLEYDRHSYPTGFWKSPFFSFFQINHEVALDTFGKLLNFCTDRWADNVSRHSSGRVPSVTLALSDGNTKEFIGSSQVYDWCLSNTNSDGQINSGLAALERWLSLQVSAGEDVTPFLDMLLRTANSVAILCVLINIGKLKPELFLGVLKPLTTNQHLFRWDYHLVESLPTHFGAVQLAPQGELIFGTARDWHFSPHHQASLISIIVGLIRKDSGFADDINRSTAAWELPNDEKAALEHRILSAQLDYNNYVASSVVDGKAATYEFELPSQLSVDIEAFRQSKAEGQTIVTLPDYCLAALGKSEQLSADNAQALASCLTLIENENSLEEHFRKRARIAVASTLIVKSGDWLRQQPDIRLKVDEIVAAELSTLGETAEALRSSRHEWRDELSFLAYSVFQSWLNNPSEETDAAVMRLMTSCHRGAESVLFGLARLHRQQLGSRWARFIDLGLLWAGLSILRPRFEEETLIWDAWLKRFKSWRLSADVRSIDRIDAVALANRVERLERGRWRREFNKPGWHGRIPLEERRSTGLDWSFLETAFGWLAPSDPQEALPSGSPGDVADDRRLLLSLWSFEVWLRHRTKEDRDDDQGPTQLGYRLVDRIAVLIVEEPLQSAKELWEPILLLGAPAHYAVGHFLQSWFAQASSVNPNDFAARWRPMIEYALSASTWAAGNPWYYGQRLLTQIMGLRASSYLDTNPVFQTVVFDFLPLYHEWASTHLRRDDENVSALCAFLSSATGKRLRFEGLCWLHAALVGDDAVYIGWRSGSLEAMVNLLDVILADDILALSSDAAARSTFLALIDVLVAKQVSAALTLQERARRLLRPERL